MTRNTRSMVLAKISLKWRTIRTSGFVQLVLGPGASTNSLTMLPSMPQGTPTTAVFTFHLRHAVAKCNKFKSQRNGWIFPGSQMSRYSRILEEHKEPACAGICQPYTLQSVGISGPQDGGTVAYKAIFVGIT